MNLLTYKYHLFILELITPEENFYNTVDYFLLFNLFPQMSIRLLE